MSGDVELSRIVSVEPRTVKFSAVREALEILGITEDPNDIMSVRMEPMFIVVEMALRNESGHKFLVAGDVARDVFHIRMDYSQDAP